MEDAAARRAAQSLVAAHKANVQFSSLGPDQPRVIPRPALIASGTAPQGMAVCRALRCSTAEV